MNKIEDCIRLIKEGHEYKINISLQYDEIGNSEFVSVEEDAKGNTIYTSMNEETAKEYLISQWNEKAYQQQVEEEKRMIEELRRK